MTSKLSMKAAAAAAFACACALSGLGAWPIATAQPAFAATGGDRAVLYWKDPDGKADFSPAPKKTPGGRDYLPVYEDEESGFKDDKPKKPKGAGKILYYRNPMGLADVSPTPKKDSMGMDYVAVYEGEEEDGLTVKIAPGKLQRTGVRSEAVSKRKLFASIRAPGVVEADEHRQSVVALRFDAFLNELEHITTGSKVRKGEPLMRVYSSALSAAAAQYVTDLALRSAGPLPANRGARQRLENLGVPDEIVKDIEQSREGSLTVTWPAPRDGYITEHNVVEGMMAKTGDVLFRIADLSVVWVLADISERDLWLVAPGQEVTVKPRAYPGRVFKGAVKLVYPVLNKETRTARVRIELANPDAILKPNMYADVVVESGGAKPLVAAPESAIIDSGARQIVILDKGEGRFEPREVKTGVRGDGYTEIREGVSEGDKVVVSANFLIDAESNLKAALSSLAAGDAK